MGGVPERIDLLGFAVTYLHAGDGARPRARRRPRAGAVAQGRRGPAPAPGRAPRHRRVDDAPADVDLEADVRRAAAVPAREHVRKRTAPSAALRWWLRR